MDNSDIRWLIDEFKGSTSLLAKTDEELIRFLRVEKKCTKPDSMIILATVRQIPFGEAKRIVHYSETWADRRESDEIFELSVFQDLENNKAKDE